MDKQVTETLFVLLQLCFIMSIDNYNNIIVQTLIMPAYGFVLESIFCLV